MSNRKVLGTIMPYVKYNIFGYKYSISLWGYWEGKTIMLLALANLLFIFKDLVEKYVPFLFNNWKRWNNSNQNLDIPSLEIEYQILSEISTQLLKASLTKYWGANPNEVGNMVVVGHNYKNNKFFSNLLNIELGEIVKITDLTGKTLDYEVYDIYV